MERTPRENLTRGELTIEHEGKWQQVLHIHHLYLAYREFIPFFLHLFFSSEPVFLNVYGAQEQIPRNEFRQPMQPGEPVR